MNENEELNNEPQNEDKKTKRKKYRDIESLDEKPKIISIYVTKEQYKWLIENRSLRDGKKTNETIFEVVGHTIAITEIIRRMLSKEDISISEYKPKEIERLLLKIESAEKEKEMVEMEKGEKTHA